MRFDAADIEPRVTFGTNPGMGIGISEVVPRNPGENDAERAGYTRALRYMGFEEGEKITGTRVDYVFVGAVVPMAALRISGFLRKWSKGVRKPWSDSRACAGKPQGAGTDSQCRT